MNKIQFKTRKEVSTFLKEKNIDTTNWTEEKWQSINTSQAEIHIQALAEAMWDARNESTPKELKAGEWHIPFGDKISYKELNNVIVEHGFKNLTLSKHQKLHEELTLKISTARCARLSYMTFDGEIDYEKDIQLHDKLLADGHASPFEHCARAMSDLEYRNFTKTTPFPDKNGHTEFTGWCNNFRGFIPYRYLVEVHN